MSRSIDPLLIVVGGAHAIYRGYCVEQAAAAHRIALIDAKPPTWQRSLVVDHEVADPYDPQALITAGLALAERHAIAGVVTWDEYTLVPTAQLTARLGLPGNSVESVTACRDKATSRRRFAEAGVPSAVSTRVDTLAEAASAADATGFPVVLKPSAHGASIGVIRVDGPEDLAAGWKFTFARTADQGTEGTGVLVEEYLDGPEVSVECVTWRGETTVVALARKDLDFPPFFEEIGHTVTAGDPLIPEVAPIAASALRALGVTDGVQHVEIRLTPTGPRVIEVNCRIAGDLIGKLVHLATGLELPRIAADIACGRTPDLTPTADRTAAIRLLYPPNTGTLTDRRLSLPAGEPPEWLYQVCWLRTTGEHVALPPHGDASSGRIGFLIVVSDSPIGARGHLDELTERLTLTVTPDPAADALMPATS